jgi:hypothetical protein
MQTPSIDSRAFVVRPIDRRVRKTVADSSAANSDVDHTWGRKARISGVFAYGRRVNDARGDGEMSDPKFSAVFEFSPLDYVSITLFGLNYRGRVARCMATSGKHVYEVEYVNDTGELKRGEFNEDELKHK